MGLARLQSRLVLASALTGTSGKSIKHGQASWIRNVCCNVLNVVHLMLSLVMQLARAFRLHIKPGGLYAWLLTLVNSIADLTPELSVLCLWTPQLVGF